MSRVVDINQPIDIDRAGELRCFGAQLSGFMVSLAYETDTMIKSNQAIEALRLVESQGLIAPGLQECYIFAYRFGLKANGRAERTLDELGHWKNELLIDDDKGKIGRLHSAYLRQAGPRKLLNHLSWVEGDIQIQGIGPEGVDPESLDLLGVSQHLGIDGLIAAFAACQGVEGESNRTEDFITQVRHTISDPDAS